MADRGPEAGHVRPGVVAARHARSGHRSLPEGLAPVLHPQAPARPRGWWRAPDRPRTRRRRPPCASTRPSARRRRRAGCRRARARSARGRTPVAISTRSQSTAASSSSVSRSPAPAGSMAASERPAVSSTPASWSHAASRAPTSGPRRASCGESSGVIRRTEAPRMASETAASHPMNPPPTTAMRAPGGAAAASSALSSTVRTSWTPGASAPGIGSRTGWEPVQSAHRPVGDLLPGSRSGRCGRPCRGRPPSCPGAPRSAASRTRRGSRSSTPPA